MSERLGRVAALWRYPVKSMRGEAVPSLALDARGAVGDRFLALRDAAGKLGSGKSSRRFRRIDGLLEFTARTTACGVVIRFPDGREMAADDPAIDAALGAACGVDVSLARETEDAPHRDAAPLHLVSEAALAALGRRLPEAQIEAQRFRPNIVIAPDPAALALDAWIGRTIALGDKALIRIERSTARCVMVTQAQAELDAAPAVLRALEEESAACFGVYAAVLRAGVVGLDAPLCSL